MSESHLTEPHDSSKSNPPEIVYRIKPLVWRLVGNNFEYVQWWISDAILGTINVYRELDGCCHWNYCFDGYLDKGQHSCESIEAGKAAAEAYYRERLLPALEVIE